MALNSNALMLPGQGYILLNEPGSQYEPTIAELEAFAADTTKLPKGAQILGHTSREDLVAMGKDGGDSSVLGSWEQEQIETVVTEAAVEYVDVVAHQFDNTMFDLYYGGGDSSQANRYAVPKNAVPPKKSVCIVYLTRGQVVGQFFPHTSVRGEDAMEHAVDAWSTIPLRFTILDPVDGGSRQVWIGRNFGADANATSGGTLPAVASVAPTSAAPGERVILTGRNFTGASQVTFGGAQASFVADSGTQITATVPTGTAGEVDVVVTTPQGASTAVKFTLTEAPKTTPAAQPTVSSLTPDTGALAGGETVTIKGTGFTGATGVTFGGVPAGSFTVVSDTEVTAQAPKDADNTPGGVDVVVQGAGGDSAPTTYTYA